MNGKLTAVGILRMILIWSSRVAISYSDDSALSFKSQCQTRTSIRNYASLLVLYLYSYYCNVAPIGCNGSTVSLDYYFVGRLRSLDGLRQDALAILIANSYNTPWLIDSPPFQVSVFGHLLSSQFLTVHGQFHFVAVAISPHINLLAFMSLQIPMWEDV